MQHRAYQSLLPSGNTYLQQKWDQASYQLHITKIKSAKATVSVTPPKTFAHLKMKKQKLDAERTVNIQRENHKLADKISNIMRTTGRVDNRNDYERKSLGEKKRQQELLRIARENQTLLLRLSRCRSEYGAACWQDDWLKTLSVMDAIARYPRGGGPQQKFGSQGREGLSRRDRDGELSTQAPASNQNNDKSKHSNNKSYQSNKVRAETEANESRTHSNLKQHERSSGDEKTG